jgi:hypothetical protein
MHGDLQIFGRRNITYPDDTMLGGLLLRKCPTCKVQNEHKNKSNQWCPISLLQQIINCSQNVFKYFIPSCDKIEAFLISIFRDKTARHFDDWCHPRNA